MCGLAEAGHAEYDAGVAVLLIAPVSCPVPNREEGAPRLSGRLRVTVRPDSAAGRAYSRPAVEEEFTCSYELNPAFQAALEAGGLRFTGFGERGEPRIAELPDHPFFLATLFLPQLSSARGRPHPLLTAYLEAVLRVKRNGVRS